MGVVGMTETTANKCTHVNISCIGHILPQFIAVTLAHASAQVLLSRTIHGRRNTTTIGEQL